MPPPPEGRCPNIPRRVEEFVQQARRQANMTRGRHIMLTMGSDFRPSGGSL